MRDDIYRVLQSLEPIQLNSLARVGMTFLSSPAKTGLLMIFLLVVVILFIEWEDVTIEHHEMEGKQQSHSLASYLKSSSSELLLGRSSTPHSGSNGASVRSGTLDARTEVIIATFQARIGCETPIFWLLLDGSFGDKGAATSMSNSHSRFLSDSVPGACWALLIATQSDLSLAKELYPEASIVKGTKVSLRLLQQRFITRNAIVADPASIVLRMKLIHGIKANFEVSSAYGYFAHNPMGHQTLIHDKQDRFNVSSLQCYTKNNVENCRHFKLSQESSSLSPEISRSVYRLSFVGELTPGFWIPCDNSDDVVAAQSLNRTIFATGAAANPAKSCAVILAGQLRVSGPGHVRALREQFRGCDVFIWTYEEYTQIASLLTSADRYIIGTAPQLAKSNMYQWFALHQVLQRFGEELRSYAVVLRSRVDVLPMDNVAFLKKSELVAAEPGFSADTDRLFGARGGLFVRVMGSFWPAAVSLYSKRMPSDREQHEFRALRGARPHADDSGCMTDFGWIWDLTWSPGFYSEASFGFHVLNQTSCARLSFKYSPQVCACFVVFSLPISQLLQMRKAFNYRCYSDKVFLDAFGPQLSKDKEKEEEKKHEVKKTETSTSSSKDMQDAANANANANANTAALITPHEYNQK